MVFLILAIFAGLALATWLRPWPLFPATHIKVLVQDRNVATPEFKMWVARQADARGLNVRGVARPVPLECPKCHKSSHYFVYPDELCQRCWLAQLEAESTPATENSSQLTLSVLNPQKGEKVWSTPPKPSAKPVK